MSEHKIAQDNIDIDVDVSSTVADDQERDSAASAAFQGAQGFMLMMRAPRGP